MSIYLTVPLPPSANAMYRSQVIQGKPRPVKSAAYRSYETLCGMTILAHGKQTVPSGPLSFTAWFFFGNRRRHDADNQIKAVQDVVSRTLGFDDSLIQEVHAYRRYDKSAPRCEIEIREARLSLAPEK